MNPPAEGVFLGAPPEYIETLRRKKEAVARLCAALHEFLTYDIDQVIEQLSRRPANPPRRPRPTIEHLNAAQQEVDEMEQQIEALKRVCATFPDDIREAYLESQLPTLQRLAQPARDRVSMIQALMEEPEESERDPSSPWDGSHRISTMCAQCARPYDGYATSIPKLKVVLKDAGWGRDADGDHICPGCVAVNTESARLNPPPTGNR